MAELPTKVKDFLSNCAPFDSIDAHKLNTLLFSFTTYYLTQENKDEFIAQNSGALFLIQSGHFIVAGEGDKKDRYLSEGDYFGFHSGLQNRLIEYKLEVETPGLIYSLPFTDFVACLDSQPRVARFFRGLLDNNLQHQELSETNSVWLYTTISSVIDRQAVAVAHTASIHKAAHKMSDQNVSSVLITQDERLVGIVTDRDLRCRVVAENLALETPVEQIMTPEPTRIKSHKTLFDALSVMAAKNIHHLPVVGSTGIEPIGMLTASDMLKHQRSNILFLIHEVGKSENLNELIHTSRKVRDYFSKHAKKVGDFDIAGKVLAQATDLMTSKLINFHQHDAGPAPLKFCWLAFGSQAREDQNLGADQDNALLLEADPDQKQADYFTSLADYVCSGLGQCGIRLCKGNIMASNPKLRASIRKLVEQAKSWVDAPTPEAIMHFNIFLDVRAVAGDGRLLEQLHTQRAPLLTRSIFLAALAQHMNRSQVPLSIFGKFITAKSDTPKGCIDLKTRGIAIINELVRLYALENTITNSGTITRINKLSKLEVLTNKDATNLKEVWLFINRLRWRHQIDLSCEDNFVAITELSSLERHQLKNAFEIIKRAQEVAVMRFAAGFGN